MLVLILKVPAMRAQRTLLLALRFPLRACNVTFYLLLRGESDAKGRDVLAIYRHFPEKLPSNV